MSEIDNRTVKFLYLPFLLLMGTILGITVNYVKTETSNYFDYFHYTSIESTKDSYNKGEDIYFISTLDRFSETDMEYIDILRCNFGGDYTWFSQSVTYSQDLHPGYYKAVWRYDGAVPIEEGTCFLDSSPTVKLGYGVSKTQKIISNTFTIGE